MRRLRFILQLIVVLAGATVLPIAQTADAGVVGEVRAAIAKGDFAAGEAILKQYRSTYSTTPEAIAALSWMARGALAAKQLDRADRYAVEANNLAVAALKNRKLDEEEHLQTALGAAIEVRAFVQSERGARSDAVYFLRQALDKYRDTAIHKRIQKNINLLSLEGQPAPALAGGEYLGRPVPRFNELKGKVVLLFFWAHWCPDCKVEGPILEKVLDKYRSRGLVVIAPTQRYGYVAAGQPAPPDEELRYIAQVRDTYYGFLRDEPVPVSDVNHKQYGVASTPTLALLDRQGIVRVYHPGRMTEQELDAAIRELL